MTNCPCGRNKAYAECCQRIHDNMSMAITAEDLMRSRYSAFTLCLGDYLFESHHSKNRVVADKLNIEKWAKSVQWMSLEVLDTSNGLVNDEFGTVEFKAFFIEAGKLQIIHENSTFSKENGHWVYVDAK
jgi:SEC-C motif-containing protein